MGSNIEEKVILHGESKVLSFLFESLNCQFCYKISDYHFVND